MIGTTILITVLCIIAVCGIRVVRPTHKGLIETLGKYTRTGEQGFHWIIPVIQSMKYVNITERMVDVRPQMVITKICAFQKMPTPWKLLTTTHTLNHLIPLC